MQACKVYAPRVVAYKGTVARSLLMPMSEVGGSLLRHKMVNVDGR
jgi:hypothetical protein